MIFVFGSNRKGIHGGGAARVALKSHGAIWGIGEGLQGDSYALPTCSAPGEPLSMREVEAHVSNFLFYAAQHPDIEFQVTRVGCGIAGFDDKEIAPLFKHAPDNCLFDEAWRPLLGDQKRYWGTY